MVDAHIRRCRTLAAGWHVAQIQGAVARHSTAVEKTVVIMEDDETFDALDAGQLPQSRRSCAVGRPDYGWGNTPPAGGVGCVRAHLRNPVRAARKMW